VGGAHEQEVESGGGDGGLHGGEVGARGSEERGEEERPEGLERGEREEVVADAHGGERDEPLRAGGRGAPAEGKDASRWGGDVSSWAEGAGWLRAPSRRGHASPRSPSRRLGRTSEPWKAAWTGRRLGFRAFRDAVEPDAVCGNEAEGPNLFPRQEMTAEQPARAASILSCAYTDAMSTFSTVGSRPKSSLNFCCASLSVTSTSTPRSVPSSASSEIARTFTVNPWRWSACTAQYFPTSPRPPCREARRHVRTLMTPSRSLRREPREAPSWRRVPLFWLPGQLSQSSIKGATAGFS
jgi:hypothetical protein